MATPSEEIGKHWTHCSFARKTRLILVVKVEARDELLAQSLVQETASQLSQSCHPLWLIDGWKVYIYALLLQFHLLVYQIKRRGKGRPPKPKTIPQPILKHVQMVKQRE